MKRIPYDKLEQIASIFGCSVADLVRDDPAYALFGDSEQEDVDESMLVTDQEDIELLKWSHGLTNKERSFFKKLFSNNR